MPRKSREPIQTQAVHVNICKLASLSRSRILTLSLSVLVSMKIVAIVPHDNSSCASPKSRDEINLNESNRARNSLLHVQLNAPCTRSADYPVACATHLRNMPRTCAARVAVHAKNSAHFLVNEASAHPLCTMRKRQKPRTTRIARKSRQNMRCAFTTKTQKWQTC